MRRSSTEWWNEEAKALHRKIPVFLGHLNYADGTFMPAGEAQCDLVKLKAAGIRALVVSTGYVGCLQTGPDEYVPAGPTEWVLEKQWERIDEVVQEIERCPRTRLITRGADLEAEPKGDSIGVLIHLAEGVPMIDPSAVDSCFSLGVRAVYPAMPHTHRACSAPRGSPSPALADLSRERITRMNTLGITLDAASGSDETAQGLIRASTKPIIASHTTSRDRVPSSRGLRNETLAMIARSGGVVGVSFADHMLAEAAWRGKYADLLGAAPRVWRYHAHVLAVTDDPEERLRLRDDMEEQERFYFDQELPPDPPLPSSRAARVTQLADLIDYLIDHIGLEHVAIGGDVNGLDEDQWPAGMDHLGELPHLTAELLKRDYRVEALRKLLSDNWRRVYAACLPE
jgi:membrane dipeptidase